MMNTHGRTQLALGVLLILAGAWFLLDRTLPGFNHLFGRYTEFPFNMFLIGGVIFLAGLILAQPGFSVPASIVAGLGGIFYYQKISGNAGSWAYLWTLIFGFIGFGTALQGLLGDDMGYNLRRGLKLIAFSAVLFLVFSSFFGGWELLGNFGPALLLIILGAWMLGSGIYRMYRRRVE
jgi:hypothetical protein